MSDLLPTADNTFKDQHLPLPNYRRTLWKPLSLAPGARLYRVNIWWPSGPHRPKAVEINECVVGRSPSHAASLIEPNYRNQPGHLHPVVTGHAMNVCQPAHWWDGEDEDENLPEPPSPDTLSRLVLLARDLCHRCEHRHRVTKDGDQEGYWHGADTLPGGTRTYPEQCGAATLLLRFPELLPLLNGDKSNAKA